MRVRPTLTQHGGSEPAGCCANVGRRHLDVIQKAAATDSFESLVKYLLMVRKKVKDSKVDTELVYAYARTSQLGPMEEFISGTHQANLQSVGDRWPPGLLQPPATCRRIGRRTSVSASVEDPAACATNPDGA